jgi:hypothetical protein
MVPTIAVDQHVKRAICSLPKIRVPVTRIGGGGDGSSDSALRA